MFSVPKLAPSFVLAGFGTWAFDLGLRQKKLAETQKLETMYSSLLEKFNNEETIFEENILVIKLFFSPSFFSNRPWFRSDVT